MAQNEHELSSLLDAIINKKEEMSESKNVIYSLVYVSRLNSSSSEDKREIGKRYEELAKTVQNRYQVDGPTGLLLIYPLHCVHILEGTCELIQAVIEDLYRLNASKGPLLGSKILSLVSNVTRLYAQWSYRVIQIAVLPKGETFETNETIPQVVSALLNSLYQIGVQLRSLEHSALKQFLDDLKTKASDLLPRQDVLEYCLNHKELLSPKDYINRYTKPVSYTLDSEVVWPLPIRLFPYN